jgi:hypothetical protein
VAAINDDCRSQWLPAAGYNASIIMAVKWGQGAGKSISIALIVSGFFSLLSKKKWTSMKMPLF